MSQQPGDAKPNLIINVVHNGTPMIIKLATNMRLRGVFDAAEKYFGIEPGTVRLLLHGKRLSQYQTPASLGLVDGDEIDAFLELGGPDICTNRGTEWFNYA